MHKYLIVFLISIILGQDLLSLDVYTFNFPPFSYTENGIKQGKSYEIVSNILKKSGLKYEEQILPWSRAYHQASNKKGTLIFPIGRTSSRENKFLWIGSLGSYKQSAFSLKKRDDIQIKKLNDLKKYKIGTNTNDFRETYLISKGFKNSHFIRTGGHDAYITNFKRLIDGKIDIWTITDLVAFYYAKKEGYNPKKILKKVYSFHDLTKQDYWLAASKGTSEKNIKIIRNELFKFKKTKEYKKILNKYLTKKIFKTRKVKIHSFEFPPYNYRENKKFIGASHEIVQHILKLNNIEYSIESLPWARTYNQTLKTKNSLIYSIGRLEKREKSFKWIGPLVPSIQGVYALKNRTDIEIEKIEDLKNYKIGTNINDFRETYLLSKGFTHSDFIRNGGKDAYINNYKRLKEGVIELISMPEGVLYHIAKEEGDSPEDLLRRVFTFSEISKDYYLASSLNTNEDLFDILKKSLSDFKKTKKYHQILKKYNLKSLKTSK